MMVDGVVGGGQGQASVGSGARVACSHIHAWVNVLPKNDFTTAQRQTPIRVRVYCRMRGIAKFAEQRRAHAKMTRRRTR